MNTRPCPHCYRSFGCRVCGYTGRLPLPCAAVPSIRTETIYTMLSHEQRRTTKPSHRPEVHHREII